MLQDLLNEANNALIKSDPHIIRIRRSHLWQDGLRAFMKPTFSTHNQLSIHFISEVGADEGGPRREFLRLLKFNLLERSGVFEGAEDGKKNFALDPVLLQRKVYFHAGVMAAMSLQQGGPGE